MAVQSIVGRVTQRSWKWRLERELCGILPCGHAYHADLSLFTLSASRDPSIVQLELKQPEAGCPLRPRTQVNCVNIGHMEKRSEAAP